MNVAWKRGSFPRSWNHRGALPPLETCPSPGKREKENKHTGFSLPPILQSPATVSHWPNPDPKAPVPGA